MIQQDKIRVLMMYYGCNVEYGYEGRKRKGLITGNNAVYGIEIFDSSRLTHLHHNVDPDLIQLILKPLSKISDEDAIEVAKIALPLPFHRHTKGWKVTRDFAITGWPYIKVHNPKNVYSFQIDCTCCWFSIYNMDQSCTQESDIHIVDIIDYLRSHSYALPHKGQDLFEAGIAIESK